VREREIVRPKQSYSESQTSSEESDDSNNASNMGATMWVKEDETPNLGPFTGNPGVKQIPSDPTKVSEIIEPFFGENFFEILSKETNLYYFQTQGKYDSSSKGLKWVDVSVAEMKNVFCNNHSNYRGANKKRQTKRLLVYRSIFRYSHFQKYYEREYPATKMRYKEFLLQVAKDWAAGKMEAVEPESDTDSMRPEPSTQTPRRPHGGPPGRLSGDMRKHVLEKIVKVKRVRGSILLGAAMFVQLTKKGVQLTKNE
jgi:hypothetical protein